MPHMMANSATTIASAQLRRREAPGRPFPGRRARSGSNPPAPYAQDHRQPPGDSRSFHCARLSLRRARASRSSGGPGDSGRNRRLRARASAHQSRRCRAGRAAASRAACSSTPSAGASTRTCSSRSSRSNRRGTRTRSRPAGAIGLGQLMPGTAALLERQSARSRAESLRRRALSARLDAALRLEALRPGLRRLQRGPESGQRIRRHPALRRDARTTSCASSTRGSGWPRTSTFPRTPTPSGPRTGSTSTTGSTPPNP